MRHAFILYEYLCLINIQVVSCALGKAAVSVTFVMIQMRNVQKASLACAHVYLATLKREALVVSPHDIYVLYVLT